MLPDAIGRHIASTFYVEYSNTGSQAMPAPLLVVSAPPEVIGGQTIVNLPLMTLDKALVRVLRILDVSASPQGIPTPSKSWLAAKYLAYWSWRVCYRTDLLRRHGATMELHGDFVQVLAASL